MVIVESVNAAVSSCSIAIYAEYICLLGLHWDDGNSVWTVMEKIALVSW